MDLARIQQIISNKNSGKNGVQQEIEYIKSPIYKSRLKKAGVKDIDQLISKRVEALEKTKIVPATQFQSNMTTDQDNPVITLEKGASPYTMQHEIVHASKGAGETVPSYKDPFMSKGTQMSPAESWMFYNRNKNLLQKAPETKVVDGKVVSGLSDKTMKQKMYEEYSSSDYFAPDIAKEMYGKEFPTEMHKYSAQENAGDLGAFRKLLLDRGITKKYGENINSKQLEKALSDPKIKNEKHTKRLLDSFDKKSIIELNNAVAALRSDKNKNQA